MTRPMAWPNFKQRAGVGNGCCTVLISIGIVFAGRFDASGHNNASGIVKA